MELKCANKKCLHEWNYKGKLTDDKDLISCPKCHYRNPLGKLKSLTHSLSLPIEKEHENTINHSLTHSKKENLYPHGKVITRPETDFEIKPDEEKPEVIGHTNSGKEIIKSSSHLGEVREIKSNMQIKTIPYDPLKHIEHMKNYG